MKHILMHKAFISLCFFSTMHTFTMLQFEQACPTQKDFLVNFAIQSNDIYRTRTADIMVAKNVFDISETTFSHGVVEILKLNQDIIGFFTLKTGTCADTDSCELGHLFVKAGSQKQGIGSILFHRAVLTAKTKGYKKMIWISDPDAKEFYLKHNALITGYDENLLNPGVPVPLFSYDIS